MKRLFDCIVASCGLILLSPLFAALAVLVKAGDGGPIFYRGRRVGLAGKHFRMMKFRTMVEQAERLGGPSTAAGDPRVTSVGRWLRKYKLDELPQLINVFKGDMSLVGPRPEVQQYVDLFTDEEKAILSVRPGLTDWATLWNIDESSRLEGSPDPEKVYLESIRPVKLKLQLSYVRQHTFGTDIQIIWRTIAALFRRSPRATVGPEEGVAAR
jgi:lipopolysaccharide/colanic/teichoic acid biosynthesis glycosyltransferase